MSALAKSYADKVEYNGVEMAAVNVLANKQTWLQRWPIQKLSGALGKHDGELFGKD